MKAGTSVIKERSHFLAQINCCSWPAVVGSYISKGVSSFAGSFWMHSAEIMRPHHRTERVNNMHLPGFNVQRNATQYFKKVRMKGSSFGTDALCNRQFLVQIKSASA